MIGLLAGPIHVLMDRNALHPAVRIHIGDCEIVVSATPKGRRVFVLVDDGSADVQVTRRNRNGTWT